MGRCREERGITVGRAMMQCNSKDKLDKVSTGETGIQPLLNGTLGGPIANKNNCLKLEP
jgi:hypothetical protein